MTSAHNRLLIIDDIADNIQLAMSILMEENYQISFALSGAEALQMVMDELYDLILLDIMMPGQDGFKICQQLKSYQHLQDVPIIFLTSRADAESLVKGFQAGAIDFISRPYQANELLSRVKTHLYLYHDKQDLKHENMHWVVKNRYQQSRLANEHMVMQQECIALLGKIITATTDETEQHIQHVAHYSRLLARYHPTVSEKDEDIIYHVACVHDLGKIFTPIADTCKTMQTQPDIAHDYLAECSSELFKIAAIIVRQYHEHWDGSGSPRGLKKHEIHLFARIVSVAVGLDNLISSATLQQTQTVKQISAALCKQSGAKFDPELIDIVVAHWQEFIVVSAA